MKLRQLLYSRVGHERARLDGLTLNMCDSDKAPADTVIWGDNGTGKTSLFHLFFSIFHPHQRKFLGKVGDGERSFDLYFQTNDLAFMVMEMEEHISQEQTRNRIIGRCIQKIKDDGNRAEYAGNFFSFIADDLHNVTILPLTQNVRNGTAQYLQSPDQFRSWYQSTFRDRHDLEPTIVSDKDKAEWQRHLTSIGIDLDILDLQMRLNHGEGSTKGFLEHLNSEDSIVRFLTDMLMHQEGVEAIRKLIAKHRQELRDEPLLRKKRDYNHELLSLVRIMAPDAERLVEATKRADFARHELAVVHARLQKTRDEIEVQRREQEERTASISTELDETDGVRAKTQNEVAWLQVEHAKLASEEAQAVYVLAAQAKTVADEHVEIAKSIIKSEEIAFHENEKKRVQEELAERVTSALPFLEKARNAGQLFEDLLEGAISQTDSLLLRENGALATKKKEQLSVLGHQQDLNRRKASAQTEGEGIRKTLAAEEDSLAQLRREKIVVDAESCEQACSRLCKSIDDNRKAFALLEKSKLEDASRKAGLSERLKTEKETSKSLGKKNKNLEEQMGVFETEKVSLSADPKLLALLPEMEEVDPYAPGLTTECVSNLKEAESELRAISDRIQFLAELLSEIEANKGLIPPSPDVQHVIAYLASERIQAVPYWHYFSENRMSVDEIRVKVQLNPARYSGITVLKKTDLERAAQISDKCPELKSPVLLTWYGDKDGPGAKNDGVLFHADTGLLCDAKTARERVQALDDERAQLGKSRDRITRKVEDGEKGIDLLKGFLVRYQSGFHDEMQREVQSIVKQIDTCTSEIVSINHELENLEENARQQTSRNKILPEAKELLDTHLRRVDDHILQYAKQKEQREQRLAELSNLIAHLEADEKSAASALEAIDSAISAIEKRVSDLRIQRTRFEEARGRIKESGGNPQVNPPSARESIEAAQRHYEEAETDYTRQSNDVALAELNVKLGEVTRKLSRLNQDYSEKFSHIHAAVQEALKGAHPQLMSEELLVFSESEALTLLHAEADAKAHHKQVEQVFIETRKASSGKRMETPRDVPKNAAEAKELVAQLEALIKTYIGSINKLQEQLRICDAKVKELATGLQRLTDQIDSSVISSEWKGQVGTLHRPYESVDDAIDRWKAVLKEASQADQKAAAEKKGVDLHKQNVHNLIYDETKCHIDAEITQQFRDNMERLHLDCTKVSDTLQDLIASMDSHLSRFEQNRKEIIRQLHMDSKEIIGRLKALGTISTLPDMGPFWQVWEGKPFITFKVRGEANSNEYAQQKVEGYLLDLVKNDRDDIPSAKELLTGSILSILSGKFSIETLCPNQVPTLQRYRISDRGGLAGWSGGERLTGVILFYLSLAQLVTLRRGSRRTDISSFLLLDNPYGSTTLQAFIDLQFSLARLFNIQLISSTCTKETDILASYPKILGMRKVGIDRKTNAIYVRETQDCPELVEAFIKNPAARGPMGMMA